MAPLPDLPDAELDVLAVLWRRGESTSPEIREVLAASRPMSLGALATLLKRLEDKGKVRRRKADSARGYRYRAAARPLPILRRVLGDLRTRVFGGSKVDLVSSLYEADPPNAEELNELEQLVRSLRGREEGRA